MLIGLSLIYSFLNLYLELWLVHLMDKHLEQSFQEAAMMIQQVYCIHAPLALGVVLD